MAPHGMSSPLDSRTLEVTRLIDAPPALVFEAWTTAEHLKRWFCPDGFTVHECLCEFREGGRFDICMRAPDGGDHWSRARFTEIRRPGRIGFSSRIAVADGDPRYAADTVVTFEAEGEGTRLHVRQTLTLLDPSAEWMVEAAEPGWRDGLDKLETLVAVLKEQKG